MPPITKYIDVNNQIVYVDPDCQTYGTITSHIPDCKILGNNFYVDTESNIWALKYNSTTSGNVELYRKSSKSICGFSDGTVYCFEPSFEQSYMVVLYDDGSLEFIAAGGKRNRTIYDTVEGGSIVIAESGTRRIHHRSDEHVYNTEYSAIVSVVCITNKDKIVIHAVEIINTQLYHTVGLKRHNIIVTFSEHPHVERILSCRLKLKNVWELSRLVLLDSDNELWEYRLGQFTNISRQIPIKKILIINYGDDVVFLDFNGIVHYQGETNYKSESTADDNFINIYRSGNMTIKSIRLGFSTPIKDFYEVCNYIFGINIDGDIEAIETGMNNIRKRTKTLQMLPKCLILPGSQNNERFAHTKRAD